MFGRIWWARYGFVRVLETGDAGRRCLAIRRSTGIFEIARLISVATSWSRS
jgi:hypothetical protein